MSTDDWRTFEGSGLHYGGFCTLLRECLERVGVRTSRVLYKGRKRGSGDSVPTEVRLTVPADPCVPEFEQVVVFAFELSVAEAHTTAARRAVREVHAHLRDRLARTPYRFVPRGCRDPRDLEREAQEFHHDDFEESDERLRVAARCIHAQDLTLCHYEREMEVLRRGWDNSIGHNAMLEGQLEGLSCCLERLDQTNCRLRDESNAAPDAFKDAEKIAMLEAKIVQMEEALHLRNKLIDKKRAQLRDKDELVGNLNTVLATKDGAINQLHHRLHRNYDNIVHLSSRCYRDRDMVERLQAA
ncbi:hypothetical protein SETIT_1G108700v2 [Setaria italica]|uniref:Uncharacterized protein n=1 Tax=Setaria italica TaxID=4555 RepID=A0A368PJ01_SETIT|nr:uncharacterized protein LOC101778826 [Setaria italica]RCV05757.1 hypothetical protein SETIT_1G108700v2 [Setaria italica]